MLSKNYGVLILYVCIGAILGGLLGELLSGIEALNGVLPYLVHSYPVLEIPPAIINIYVIKFTVGISFMPNLMSIIGVILAVFIFRRTMGGRR